MYGSPMKDFRVWSRLRDAREIEEGWLEAFLICIRSRRHVGQCGVMNRTYAYTCSDTFPSRKRESSSFESRIPAPTSGSSFRYSKLYSRNIAHAISREIMSARINSRGIVWETSTDANFSHVHANFNPLR